MRIIKRVPKVITPRFLTLLGACEDDLDTFRKLWPDGCRVTERNIVKALEEAIDVYWFCKELHVYLDLGTREQYDQFRRRIELLDLDHSKRVRALRFKHDEQSIALRLKLEAEKRRVNTREAKVELAYLQTIRKARKTG